MRHYLMNRNGWSGGQYSLFRSIFGAWLFVHFLRMLSPDLTAPAIVPTGIAVGCSLLFLCGFVGRGAALVLTVAGIMLHTWWVPAAPLLLHCFLPGAPYGSLAARGRPDPSGRWRMPQALWLIAWAALAGVYITSFYAGDRLFDILPGLLMLHLIAFNPAWIRPILPNAPERIFYDGHCGLCHHSVRFVLAEDCHSVFRFAPLHSQTFLRELTQKQQANVPDSLVVLTDTGHVLTRSAALLHIGKRLGGFWRALAEGAEFLPSRLLDALYNCVARIRYQLFRSPEEFCPVVPNELRSRFDK